ncbi:hypothetical protein [Flavivirga sp. 57AJ16]|uniref:hypothetical protein n=1 Tax=Flavivirga sp. 57AJ16 TaxID=3025307 RepID=UPI002365B042|nr:hypothetical protein [Flavivirga sp. 57AJ16]MDD7887104.1 hypothetical protein [Flavivirga sp. 57AJ16]
MKKTIIILLVFILTNNIFSQEKKEEQSKMLNFVSQTGVILKFEDYELPKIKLSYGTADSKIRKIISGDRQEYFLQISKKGEYDTKVVSIAYEDLIEIIKALSTLQQASLIDTSNTASDYLENKFITDDGFQLGYYVSKNKLVWYMKLERYGNGATIFLKDYNTVNSVFIEGKSKIESLKQS